ncbi:MAG: glycosyltransferase family 39 protein, partial [Phycisphaerales bacterium]|nr:glycosyltransferase family 39 protein [Phycisphaerales bacterium]
MTDTLIPVPRVLTDPIAPVDVSPVLQRLHVFLGPILIAVTFFVLLYNFWGGLIDPIIDFGRELYVPWRISQGAVLYRDITSFYGPFSPLFNALCFYIFGASLLTLAIVNSVILAIATFLLHEIVRVVSARSTAAIVCVFFLVVFGFGKLLTTANFSFIAPYSHEATHGFVLALAAIYCFIRYLRSLHNGWMAAVGLCTGLVFLTKPESFVALAGFLFLAVIAMRWAMGRAFRLTIVLPLLIIFATLPIAIAVVYLASYMPFSEAWHGTLGSWTFLSNSTLTSGQFFSHWMGFQDPANRLAIIARLSGIFLVLMGPVVFMAFMIPDGRRHQRAFGCGLGVISLLILKEIFQNFQWYSTGGLMLVGMLALVICQATLLIRNRHDPATRIRLTIRLLLCAFAILMLLKMLLLTRYYHYGFILGVMATSMLAIALVDWIPAALERHGQCGWIVRGAAIALLAAIAIQCSSISHSYRPSSHSFLGQGKDQFR